jgi:hypothetical protein
MFPALEILAVRGALKTIFHSVFATKSALPNLKSSENVLLLFHNARTGTDDYTREGSNVRKAVYHCTVEELEFPKNGGIASLP